MPKIRRQEAGEENSGLGLLLDRKHFHQLRIDPSSQVNEENVLEEELGQGIGGGEGKLDGVNVDVNQLGVTMTNSLISRDQSSQLVELNRQLASTL